MRASFGTHHHDRNYNSRTIAKIILHPQYHDSPPMPPSNDIAILELSSPVGFTEKVRLICLPEATANAFSNLKFTGWGRMSPHGSPSLTLQELDPIELDISTCRRKIGAFYLQSGFRGLSSDTLNKIRQGDTEFLASKDHICVEHDDAEICPGDSGSPLTTLVNGRYYLAGVASFSLSCQPSGVKDFPSGFARASSFVDWIH